MAMNKRHGIIYNGTTTVNKINVNVGVVRS